MAIKAAIIGSGNIGTDLMIKLLRRKGEVEIAALVGIDPDSEGLAAAKRMGVAITHEGVDGLKKLDCFGDIRIVFDATSAGAHVANTKALEGHNITMIDLTPAAIGPFVVPSVNMDAHLSAKNVNMVTCGGQATIPVVAALSSVTKVHYAEIVASIASKSAGPGTRANIDEFTETTSKALAEVGGATKGKAIIVLNPAEPPLMMRDTVMCLCSATDEGALRQAVKDRIAVVAKDVPGYRLKHEVQIDPAPANPYTDEAGCLQVSVFLEVEGAGHHLPKYAGNLDIMTSAALVTSERIAARMLEEAVQ